MRTPPSKFLTDFDSSDTKAFFYCVKLVSDSTTYYWVTVKASTFTLWDTTAADGGHVALTKDSAQIAHKLNGETAYGIGAIESGLSLTFGGGVGQISGFTLIVLNQDELSETLDTKQFLNRELSLYCGFADTSTGTGLGDMLKIGTFVVDNVGPFNWTELQFTCVDRLLQLQTTVLPEVVTKDSHPRAPEESLGKPIPLLYGDFQTFNDTASNRLLELYDLAPSVLVNFGQTDLMTHQMSSLLCVGIEEVFYGTNGVVGVVDFDGGDGYIIDLLARGITLPKEFLCDWYLIPDSIASTSGAAESGANVWDNMKDKDLATEFDFPPAVGDSVYLGMSKKGYGALRGIAAESDRTVQMIVEFGDVIGGGGTYIRMIGQTRVPGTFTTNSLDVVAADSGTQKTINLAIPAGDDFDWNLVVDDWTYGFINNNVDAAVQHVCILFRSIVTVRMEAPITVPRKITHYGTGGF